MPLCFLATRGQEILFEKEAPLMSIDEVEDIANLVVQELADIYHWSFEVVELKSIKEVSLLRDEENNVTLRIFMQQFSTLQDFTKGSFRGISDNSVDLSC